MVQVKTAPTEDCAFTARAGVLEIEEATNRPVLGDVEFCFVDPNDFQFDVTTAVHELLHILVRPCRGTRCVCCDPLSSNRATQHTGGPATRPRAYRRMCPGCPGV